MKQIQPTQLIWTAAGSPDPFDAEGEPVPRKSASMGRCSMCNAPEAHYGIKNMISSTFVPTRNENRLSGYGGEFQCASCVFCARTLRLRCISWLATEDEIEFWRTRPETPDGQRPNALGKILNPPEPPFVLGLPLYGVKHGGEAHWQRTPWPGMLKPNDPLRRLQSKHVAIYARVAYSRERYPVQVDDGLDLVIDRDLWLRLRDLSDTVTALCMNDGIAPYQSKLSLERLELPRRSSSALARTWRSLTSQILPYVNAPWWGLFCELYPTPKDMSENDDSTSRTAEPERSPKKSEDSSPTACVPTQGNRPPSKSKGNGAGKVQLTLW
jgi:hypothetical protein